jgi:acyl-CoA synthetase (AMP-forming)/AMP-acid ligase II
VLDPARFVADVAKHRVTHTYAVPFEMAKVVERVEQRGERLPSHLRTIVLGSAPITRPFLRRLRAIVSPETDVWCAYAMSEMLPVSTVESREKLAWDDEGDLVGRPIPGARVSVGDDGELSVAGPNLQRAYLGREPTEWHATGDLARVDDDGRIVLLGRKKDMIIRGHHNVYPSLYEDRIASIEGVSRCAFVGLETSDHADERIVLVVEPNAGKAAEEVRAAVERALRDGSCAIDSYALPDRVVAFPLPFGGRSNKLDRTKLRELVLARGGIDAQ